MSIKFALRNAQGKPTREGDTIVRFTGDSEPFYKVSERTAQSVGLDQKGEPRLVFLTGLDIEKVDQYSWYKEGEKKEIKKQIKDLLPDIKKRFGGDDILDKTNRYFWGSNRDVSRVALTNSDLDIFYDTANPIHALFYLSIVAGAFIDLIAPTKEYADDHQLPIYMQLDTEDSVDDEDEITRSDAHAALSKLRKEADPEALFILAWCIQYNNRTYGAYLKSTSYKDLVNYHIKYIDGKLEQKGKKKYTPKVFLDYAERWEGQQTRPKVLIEAYVKAGEYYNFLNKKDRKYVTTDGAILGNTIEDVIETLSKPSFSQDLGKLRDQVEAKWKE